MKRISIFYTLLLFFSSSLLVYGGGYQLYSESGTDTLSLAGALVGRQGMESAPWYNPATSTSVERPTISGGGSLIKLAIDYASPHNGTDSMEDDVRYTGFCYATLPVKDPITFTLSVNAPYGMITHWKSGWMEDTMATYTSLRNCYITPNIAIKFTDEFSVAAGFNFVYGTARVAKMIPGNDAAGVPRNKLYMRADGTGFGYTFSAHYQPFEDWGFGAHYQSRVKMKLEGKSDYRYEGDYAYGMVHYENDRVDTTFDLPAYLAVGVANTSFKKWTLSSDVVWTEWSLYPGMFINFDQYPTTSKPGTSRAIRDWDDSLSYRFGAEYQLTEKWALRFGYMFDTTPSNSKTNSPEMPDSNKNYFSAGFNYDTGDWALAVGYAYVRFNNAKIGSETSYNRDYGRGTFKTTCNILSAQYTLRF